MTNGYKTSEFKLLMTMMALLMAGSFFWGNGYYSAVGITICSIAYMMARGLFKRARDLETRSGIKTSESTVLILSSIELAVMIHFQLLNPGVAIICSSSIYAGYSISRGITKIFMMKPKRDNYFPLR